MKEKKQTGRFRIAVVVCWLLLLLSEDAFPALARQGVQPQQEDTADNHIRIGKEAFDANNFGVAKQEAQRALKLKKDSPEANLLLALTYRKQNKSKDSLKYAKQAIAYRQDYADAHYLLAFLYFDRNEITVASAELGLAMSQGVRYANAYVLMGTLELLAGRNKNALDAYQLALKVMPPNDPFLPTLRERTSALENYIDFGSDRNNLSYQRPVLLNFPMPHYTETARQNRVQGKIRAAVLINEKGAVSSVILLSHLPDGLDDQSILAARQLKFEPATRAGKPVPFWQKVDVEFHLR